MSGGSLFRRLKAALQSAVSPHTAAPPAEAAGHVRAPSAELEAERAKNMEEFYARQREAEEAAEEASKQEARRVLAKFPPPPAGRPRDFVNVFRAAHAASAEGAAVVEGVVFDTYPVLGSRMDDSDGYDGFDMISGEEITSWRNEHYGVKVGKAVRIKYLNRSGRPHHRENSEDEILEVWVEQ